MINTSIQNLIEIYSWVVSALFMMFIVSIAIFYQKKFKINTYYYLYFIPILILLIASLHLFSYRNYISETIEFLGSLGSFLVSNYLYKKMVG